MAESDDTRPLRPARTYALSVWLFQRGLGLVYFIAFASAWVQLPGLIGSKGILPAHDHLDFCKQYLGTEAYWRVPTLCWLDCSDSTLNSFCLIGMAASLALMLGVLERWMILICWELYLSIVNVGQDFFSFQWDVLLIETSILAFFNASWRLWTPRPSHEPHWLARFLLYAACFKVVFLSGMVKIQSGDVNWANGTAMNYHFMTQPLPTSLAWTMHHLPPWVLKCISYGTIALELGAPLLMFFPGRPRLFAAFLMLGLQFAIAITGNYGFFSLLSALLCIPLIEDRFWAGFTHRKWRERLKEWIQLPENTPGPSRLKIAAPFVVWVLLLGTWIHDRNSKWPSPFQEVMQFMHASNSFNSYGAFAIMTTLRNEFELEGSLDGKTWRTYPFRWKPGDVTKFPRINTPHQPRLDWQMWFIYPDNPVANLWVEQLEKHLLEGTPEVLALLGENPFPNEPPKYIRCLMYNYEFTTQEEYNKTGACWTRTFRSQYGRRLNR